MGWAEAPLRKALAAQVGGALMMAGIAFAAFPVLVQHPLALAAGQGACAALVGITLRSPVWWLPIHLGFVPLAVVAQGLDLPPWIWLVGFVLLLLTFWRTDRSRVPLYLSNRVTSEVLGRMLPDTAVSVIDLGCGDAGLLSRLARNRPDCRFVGFEHAPLIWVWARLRCRKLPNVDIRFGDFWSHPLTEYALVYAFLSPIPMAELWRKAKTEMTPGALLVSNSFAIPGVEPASGVEVPDTRRTHLYCYRPDAT